MNEREQFEAWWSVPHDAEIVLHGPEAIGKQVARLAWQAARQSSAAELAKRKASYEELARLHSRLIAELSAAQAKVGELRGVLLDVASIFRAHHLLGGVSICEKALANTDTGKAAENE